MTKENLGPYLILILSLALLFSLSAPPDKTDVRTSEQHSAVLMQQPVPFYPVETAAQAIPVWRQFRDKKPALLLLSNHPFFMPLNPLASKRVLDLAEQGSTEELFAASDHRRADFLFVSGMATEIAHKKGWFNKLYWALPIRDQQQKIQLAEFEKNLAAAGIISENDQISLDLNDGLISGTIRQTEFFAAHLADFPSIHQDIIVHIDLSYFQPLYKNEVATPVLNEVLSTLEKLAEKNFNVLAVTFSYGHLDDQISLDVRFLGEILKTLIENPNGLKQPLPQNWLRQSDALYLNNFFQKEKIRELYEAQQHEAPNSAWVKFNLYRSAAEFKQGNLALDYLAKAVALDPIYALEYFNLAELAYNRKRPDQAVRMLKLGLEIFPQHIKSQLRLAEISAEIGDIDAARQIIRQLRILSWSDIYYPEMPAYLEQLDSMLNKPTEQKP